MTTQPNTQNKTKLLLKLVEHTNEYEEITKQINEDRRRRDYLSSEISTIMRELNLHKYG